MAVEELNGKITSKENDSHEKDKLYNDLNEQIVSVNLMLKERTLNEAEIESKLLRMLEEKNDLEKIVEEMDVKIKLMERDNQEKDKLCNDLNEQMVSCKQKFEEKNELEKRNIIMLEEKNELMKSVEELEDKIKLKESDNQEKDKMCNDLNEQIVSVKQKIEETSFKEVEIDSKLSRMLEEKNELEKRIVKMNEDKDESMKTVDELRDKILLKENENQEKEKLYHDLSVQIVSLKLKLEETSLNKGVIENKLSSMLEEKNDLQKVIELLNEEKDEFRRAVEELKGEVTLKENANEEKNKLCNDLNEHIVSIKLKMEENSSTQVELLSKKNIELEFSNEELINDNHQLLNFLEQIKFQKTELEKYVEVLNKDLMLMNEVNAEKESLCKRLSEQLIEMNLNFEQVSLERCEMHDRLQIISDEKKSLENAVQELRCENDLSTSTITHLEDKIALLSNDTRTKNSLCLDLSEELVAVKLKLEDAVSNEAELRKQFAGVLYEKDDLVMHIAQLKEHIFLLDQANQDRDSLCAEGSFGNLERDYKANIRDLENKLVSAEFELSEKEKIIQRLEKTNLLFKAKSLKLKKHYEEKYGSLNSCTKSDMSSLDIMETKERVDKSTQATEFLEHLTHSFTGIDKMYFPKSYSTILSAFANSSKTVDDILDSDEMSFLSRIENLSDEVDSRARKANLELEVFLQRNEEFTSGLSSDSGSNRKSLCESPQCQRISSKYRELSNTMTNLRQQNELMKNKIMDLQSCLESEREARKQISYEGVQIHNSFVQKLHDLSISKDRQRLEFIATQELLIEKVNTCESLTDELLRSKESCVQLNSSLSLKEKEIESVVKENEVLKLSMKEKQNLILLLEEKVSEVSNSNSSLKEAYGNLSTNLSTLNNELECMLIKHKDCLKNNLFFINEEVNSWDKLRYNISKLEDLFYDTESSNANFSLEDINESLYNLVEMVKNVCLNADDTKDDLEQRFFNILKNNIFLENQLIVALERLEAVASRCYSTDEEKCKWVEKISSELGNEPSKSPEERNLVYEVQELIEIARDRLEDRGVDIDTKEDELESDFPIVAHCEDCLKLKNEIIMAEIDLNEMLQKFKIFNNQGSEHETFDRISLKECIDVITNRFKGRFDAKYMIDGNVQTIAKENNFKGIEELINEAIDVLSYKIKVLDGGFNFMEVWSDVISELLKQMMVFKEEVGFQQQEKAEISDKFEKLFIELERSCDAEIEDLKSSIVIMSRELEVLHSEREARESALRNYEIQISYYQSVLEKPKQDLCLNTTESIPITSGENSQFWLSDLNDALKETISEKEDHITELMDRINESSSRFKESVVSNERNAAKITQLEVDITNLESSLKMKEKVILENNAVINELEAVCVDKENRINLLEKESGEINVQLEQYISAVCAMQARLEASKPNLELILTKIENKDNNMQLLNLIDQLEKDYADELEQSELNRTKIEGKLNKAVQIIHKLKRQLKESHCNEVLLGEKIRSVTLDCHCHKEAAVVTTNQSLGDRYQYDSSIRRDASVQIDDEELKLLREENTNYKGIIENLHVNNFLLWKEVDNFRKTDRNVRGSSLPLMSSSGNSVPTVESERSTSPTSQLSWNSGDGGQSGSIQIKDLQRKLQRVHQQLNQMRIERNRIHQEYSRIRQLKEVADNKVAELTKKIDLTEDRDDILTEKDELTRLNNQYSAEIVELQTEIEMTKVRNSILETKCKKMEMKLTSQRRKYDQLVLKLDEREQEIDRGSDEFRRNTSNFEKDKIIWLREKKELKSVLANKEEKITNLRKRLLSKTGDDVNCDADYLIEINQLQRQLDEQKAEHKQLYSRHREQIAKHQGQIEELIDDNRQLKRKLSLGHVDNSIQIIDSSKNASSKMRVINEDCEESSLTINNHNNEINTMLATVVLEKEKLLTEITELRNLLDQERHKLAFVEHEIKVLKVRKSDGCCDMSSQTLLEDEKSVMVADKGLTTVTASHDSISQTVYEYGEYASQTGAEFDGYWLKKFRTQQLSNCVSRSEQTDLDTETCVLSNVMGTQTESLKFAEYTKGSNKERLRSVGTVTEADNTVFMLHNEITKKATTVEQLRRQISKHDNEMERFRAEFRELSTNIEVLETKNFEYQEVIGSLQLEQIDRDRKHVQEIGDLNLKIVQLREEVSLQGNTVVDVNDKADQTLLCQRADEGWDMEWDYEKLTADQSIREVVEDGIDNVCIDTALATIVTVGNDQYSGLDNVVSNPQHGSHQDCDYSNLIAILRDEISQLKNVISEKNSEIGHLKGLRNQLQTDLMESGQQIKDSNMEFLNLKENIQVLNAEREIVRQKIYDLSGRLEEVVNFIEMISVDLRRLRDSNEETVIQFIGDKDFDDNRVKDAVQVLEHELHKLLEQLRVKDLKLESAFSQIEQLSCVIHRLQLQQSQPNEHMNTQQSQSIDSSSTDTTTNIHTECVRSMNELSELLETKHLEIEELKSRLFLATDQLIHFRTFFANTDNRLHKELLLITRHQSLGLSDDDVVKHSSGRDHTKVVIDSDDMSDSDQSLLSHDGNTVIRVERTRVPTHTKAPVYFCLVNHIIQSAQYKRLVHNFKRIFTTGRRQMVLLRSQPRINLRAVVMIYLVMLHLFVIRCFFM